MGWMVRSIRVDGPQCRYAAAMVLNVTCKRCGYSTQLGIDMRNNTFAGNAMNIGFECPNCGAMTDQTDGSDGTYSTTDDGRLVKMAEYVGTATMVELGELSARIAAIETARDEEAALAELAAKGLAPADGLSTRERARQALQDLELLGRVILMYVGGGLGGVAAAAEIIRRLT